MTCTPGHQPGAIEMFWLKFSFLFSRNEQKQKLIEGLSSLLSHF